ncbi:MAG: hypothetical protein PHP52_12340 [Bacteroidales bacterium]|nr:hypothetical protein [Bacteroidales bacterium]MDD4217413.1 hypothetical protein [Bacteroidales bacterium]
MKKYCTLFILVLVFCLNGYSQWFADIRCGYAVPVANDVNPQNNTLYYNHNAVYGYGEIFMSHTPETDVLKDLGENMPAYYVLNSGTNFSFDIGYQFSKILRLSLNGFYLNSSILPYERIKNNEYILTNSFENTITFFQHDDASNGITFTQLTNNSNLQQISPFIKIAIYKNVNKWDFSFYLNQGVSFYFIKKDIEILSHAYEYRNEIIINEKYNKIFKYTGQAGIEISYQTNNNISVFTDISFLHMSFTPDEGYITYRSTVNEQYDKSTNSWTKNENIIDDCEEISFIRDADNYDWRYRTSRKYKNNVLNFSLGIRYYFNAKNNVDKKE